MHSTVPYCLSIAGFDPCGGAGILADCKVFEQLGVHGLGIVSAITYQNESEFEGVKWTTFYEIERQLAPLHKYPVEYAKIGLIQDVDILCEVLKLLHHNYKGIRIIWDPVLKASAGFEFHNAPYVEDTILDKIDLITPNLFEFEELKVNKSRTNILLKGGHRQQRGTDILYSTDGDVEIPGAPFPNVVEKHGTGCVLSAAITAFLAKGETLPGACRKAKQYVEKFICSTNSKLGLHK